jgi:hypothetical protein
MNQHESSGSDDDGSDNEDADKLLAAAVLEAEMEDAPVLDPETLRQQEIIAEVARRRAERDNNTTATKQKSDEIFDRFDVDKDGYMNYEELRALGKATGGDLPHAAYMALCEEIGANPAKGVSKALLLTMYTDAGLGDAHRDYNIIFGPS